MLDCEGSPRLRLVGAKSGAEWYCQLRQSMAKDVANMGAPE